MPFVRQKRERVGSNERVSTRPRWLLYHKRHRKGHFDSGTVIKKPYARRIGSQQFDDVPCYKVKSGIYSKES